MATLPRASSRKQNANVSFPFSTSPRKLHEMTFPDGNGDVTSVSGISMKQYEEQLNGLKKENFHLKLRIYFLEEKLGNGSPPAIQGLLEHNVHLQVQVEELRRQLSDKHQLLAAAAQAIDVLEHQGSLSMDSDVSMNGASALQRKVENLEESGLEEIKPSDTDTQAALTTDATTDHLINSAEQEELLKLRREHHKALQMIQSCMKRIQQQEKQFKKLKKETENVSEPQAENYEEILRCKNQHIEELERKLREAQSVCGQNEDHSAGNLQELLAKRLQGLAYFLDKLLSHKCVLGEDKKRLAESLLEQSLALPVGLKLDESMAPEEFTMDESSLDISQALKIEDLTLMFGHHGICDENGKLKRRNLDLQEGPRVQSDSECWSEPDRKVSLARMGLGDSPGTSAHRPSSCEERRRQGRRPRYSAVPDHTTHEELARLRAHADCLEQTEKKLNTRVQEAEFQVQALNEEISALRIELETQVAAAESARGEAERARSQAELESSRRGEAEARVAAAAHAAERARAERLELESTFAETERMLRRAADEATLQASQAALERTRAHHERLRVERELEEAREKLAAASAAAVPAVVSDDDRPTSPDQGIDSDRLSSLELADALPVSPRSLYEENASLKQKLARTKATLADTLAQLNAANVRKMSVQRAICREIHKTQGVLRKARDQFESHS